jgi:hypothetical protein
MSTPDPTQTASGLADALARSSGLRGQAMQHLDQLHQAQQTALAIEASRVANRYGTASAEIKVVQARVAAHAARRRGTPAHPIGHSGCAAGCVHRVWPGTRPRWHAAQRR